MTELLPPSDGDRDADVTLAPATPSTPDDSRRVATLLGVLFGLSALGSAATALALVPLASAYDITMGVATWTITLYVLMLAVGTAVYGRIADLVGTRRPLIFGISIMTVGALLASLAPTFPLHLAGRFLQGAGVAAMAPLGAAVISARYAGAIRSAALLRLASIAAGVVSVGPLIGGLLINAIGWRAAVALPILGVLVVPALWSVLTVRDAGARLDYIGALLTAATAGGVVLLLQSPSTGLTTALLGLAVAVAGIPVLVTWVRRRPTGFLPLAVIKNPAVVRSAFAAAAIPAAWFAILVAVPAVLLGAGWEPWQVGLTLLPGGLVGLLMPRIAGPLMIRITAATALMISTVAAAGSLLVAALGSSLESPALLIVSIMLVTGSFGLGQPALSSAVGRAVDGSVQGVALGVATLMFMVGGSIGSAVVGGLGQVIGLGPAIALLTLLPVAGFALVAPTQPATDPA